jgi:hypothetical protein
MKLERGASSRTSAEARRGGALVLVLVLLLATSGFAFAFLELSSSVSRRQARAADRKQAFYVAEAGLSEAYVGMQIGKSGNVGSQALPVRFGRGLFWVRSEELQRDMFQLSATGLCGEGRATLSIVVEKGGESVASLGIFAEEAIAVPAGTLVDGFDSELGPYTEPVSREARVQIGSNAAMTVTSTETEPTEIHGSVVPGPLAAVTQIGDPTITGSVDARLATVQLPDVVVPTLPLEPGIRHRSALPVVLAGDVGLESLDVGANSQVVLRGPARLLVGDLHVAHHGDLTVDTTLGPVGVVVTGDLLLDPGSTLTMVVQDSTGVSFQLSGEGRALLAADASFHGAVFGPDAEVEIASAFEVFGSVVCESLVLQPGARLHFDRHLARAEAEGSLPRQLSWRIVDLSPLTPAAPGTPGRDPFDVLGVTAALCPLPADAHEDQFLKVTYVDRDGLARTYAGPESAFDWSDVAWVEAAERDGESTVRMNRDGQELFR